MIFRLGGYDAAKLDAAEIQQRYRKALADGELQQGDARGRSVRFVSFLAGGGDHAQHVFNADSSTAATQTQANIAGRRSLLRLIRFVRSLPGCERAQVQRMMQETAVRETYRIAGQTVITHEDDTSSRRFEDAVCYSFYPIDLHDRDGVVPKPLAPGTVPTVPLGALVPRDSRHLLVAGLPSAANGARMNRQCCEADGKQSAVRRSNRDHRSSRQPDHRSAADTPSWRNMMATESLLVEQPLLEVPEDLRPDVEHLVTEDDTPVDNIFSEKQQRLLTEPLYHWPGWIGESRSFIALANVGLFYAIRQPPYVPDMMLSLDVELPADLWPKRHRSYFVWEHGKPPDAVVEVVSNQEGGEDDEKLAGYARIGIRYYVIYDPARMLGDQTLRGFGLQSTGYHPLDKPLRLAGIGLGLDLWQGRYEGHEDTWLRWTDPRGQWIPTGAECIEQQRQRAEQQRQRAERLADQLRRLGVQPEA